MLTFEFNVSISWIQSIMSVRRLQKFLTMAVLSSLILNTVLFNSLLLFEYAVLFFTVIWQLFINFLGYWKMLNIHMIWTEPVFLSDINYVFLIVCCKFLWLCLPRYEILSYLFIIFSASDNWSVFCALGLKWFHMLLSCAVWALESQCGMACYFLVFMYMCETISMNK